MAYTEIGEELLAKYFTTKPDGIPGNDDTGTMSAWAIFSMMGFYPDCPGVPEYTLTTPTFDKVTVQLDPKYWGKKELVIKKEGQGDYIKEIRLGNKKINKYLISHDDLIKAGEITFIVTEILIRNNYEYETIFVCCVRSCLLFCFFASAGTYRADFRKRVEILRVKIMRNLPIPVIMTVNGRTSPFLMIGRFMVRSVSITTSRKWLLLKMDRPRRWNMPDVPEVFRLRTGWYRLNFDAPGFEKGKKATLIFDGAMSHARVYVNGQEAGYWPYGYNSFYVDATPYLKPGERNELAVRLENEPESSRWYPGAGLYRNVHLVINEDTHIPAWGTSVTTPVVTDKYAKVSLKTSLVSPEGANKDNYRIVTQIKDKNGKVVATGENKLSVFDNALFEQEFAVANPELWSPDTPVLIQLNPKYNKGIP